MAPHAFSSRLLGGRGRFARVTSEPKPKQDLASNITHRLRSIRVQKNLCYLMCQWGKADLTAPLTCSELGKDFCHRKASRTAKLQNNVYRQRF